MSYDWGLSGNIAYANPLTYFGVRTPVYTAPRQPVFTIRPPTPVVTAPSAPKPTAPTVAVLPKPLIMPVIKPGTVGPIGVPSSGSGGGGGGPSIFGGGGGGGGGNGAAPVADETSAQAGMFGFGDMNKTGLIFLALAGLVMFMESKKGHR